MSEARAAILPLSVVAFHARDGVDEQPQMVLINGLRDKGGIRVTYAVALGGRGRWVPMSEVTLALTRVPVLFVYEEAG